MDPRCQKIAAIESIRAKRKSILYILKRKHRSRSRNRSLSSRQLSFVVCEQLQDFRQALGPRPLSLINCSRLRRDSPRQRGLPRDPKGGVVQPSLSFIAARVLPLLPKAGLIVLSAVHLQTSFSLHQPVLPSRLRRKWDWRTAGEPRPRFQILRSTPAPS